MLRSFSIFALAILLLLLGLLTRSETSAGTSIQSASPGDKEEHASNLAVTPEHFTHLPRLRKEPTPEPIPTPTEWPSVPELWLHVTPGGNINASTFSPGSFTLENHSQNGVRVQKVQIDLSTSILPDMVFDPAGTAGDTVAKDLEVNADTGVGFVKEAGKGWQFSGAHDNGFDILELTFSSFDPDDIFAFSVDVDPTSIRGSGAPGPFESGSVSGLELTGATISVSFDNGLQLAGQLYHSSGSASGSRAIVREGLPAAPMLSVLGVAETPAMVEQTAQTVRVAGPANFPVRLLVVEAGLFTEGLPGGGFDLDPYEANSAVAFREHSSNTGPAGFVDIPVQLSRSQATAGLNYIVATLGDFYGRTGTIAPSQVLELQP